MNLKWPDDYVNKVILGDCMEIMKGIPKGAVDLVLTDIPYGEVNRAAGKDKGIRKLNKGAADEVDFVLSELLVQLLMVGRGSFYIFCGSEQVSEIRSFFVHSDLSTRHGFWLKTNPSPHCGQHLYLSATENIMFGKTKGTVFNGHCKIPVWQHPSGTSDLHPTQKPLAIIKDMILTSSNEGDIILDPFSGSGTTAVAAKQLNRKYIAIEKVPRFYRMNLERLKQEELFNRE